MFQLLVSTGELLGKYFAIVAWLGGGVATIREYLYARLVDEMHIAIAPVLLGSGESLFANIDLPRLGYKPTRHVATAKATHLVFTRSD